MQVPACICLCLTVSLGGVHRVQGWNSNVAPLRISPGLSATTTASSSRGIQGQRCSPISLSFPGVSRPSRPLRASSNLVAESDTEDESSFESFDNWLGKTYQGTMVAYLLAGILHVAHKGFFRFWSLYYVLGGPFLSAWIARLLWKEQRQQQQQPSNNDPVLEPLYQRLRWLLLGQGLIGLMLPLIDPTHFLRPLFVVPPLLAVVSATADYFASIGVLRSTTPRHVCAVFTDLQTNSWPSTKKTLASARPTSLDYALMFRIGLAMTVVKGVECLRLLWELKFATSTESRALALASRLSRFARLAVWTGVLATLQDLADRNLLQSKLGKALNIGTSLVFGSLGGYLLAPSSFRLGSGGLGLASLLFAGICAYNAFSSGMASPS